MVSVSPLSAAQLILSVRACLSFLQCSATCLLGITGYLLDRIAQLQIGCVYCRNSTISAFPCARANPLTPPPLTQSPQPPPSSSGASPPSLVSSSQTLPSSTRPPSASADRKQRSWIPSSVCSWSALPKPWHPQQTPAAAAAAVAMQVAVFGVSLQLLQEAQWGPTWVSAPWITTSSP